MPTTLENLQRLHSHMWGNNVINVIQAGGKTYLTVDLTLFKLPQNTSHENTLLIRDQYVLAYDIILADTRKGKKRKSAFLVTGQTGIGKTLFLLYILVRRLHERQPVALQVDASNFALFDKGGASLHESSPISAYLIPEGAWALSDSSGDEVVEPCSAFKWHRTHIVHTSSPASCHWTKDVCAIRHVMDIWSLEELQTLLSVLNLGLESGVAFIRKFGPNPRIIINILTTPAMERGEYQL